MRRGRPRPRGKTRRHLSGSKTIQRYSFCPRQHSRQVSRARWRPFRSICPSRVRKCRYLLAGRSTNNDLEGGFRSERRRPTSRTRKKASVRQTHTVRPHAARSCRQNGRSRSDIPTRDRARRATSEKPAYARRRREQPLGSDLCKAASNEITEAKPQSQGFGGLLSTMHAHRD